MRSSGSEGLIQNEINRLIFYSQMKYCSLILGALLLLQSLAFRAQDHQSPSSYLAALVDQQEAVTSDLASLNAGIADTQSKVKSATSIDEKIRLLEQAILKQKAQLGSLSKSLIVPLNESSWTCQNLNGTTDQELSSLASSIVSSTSSLDTKINQLKGVNGSEELQQDSSMAKQYGESIQQALSSEGTYVNSQPVTSQSDLSAANWVTGGLTMDQIDKQASQNNGYAVTCPPETAFFDGTKCLSCPSTNPYFNLATKQCISCSNYDAHTHTCPSLNYNGMNVSLVEDRLILPSNTTIQDVQSAQGNNVCPDYQPFFWKGNCFNCVSPNSLFDYSAGKCSSCPNGTIYEEGKHICAKGAVNVTNLAVGGPTMILPEGTTIQDLQAKIDEAAKNSDVVQCPSDKPFFNQQQCISCNGSYFNYETSACASCPTGTSFDVSTHKCMKVSFYSNLGDNQWASTNPNQTKTDIKAASQVVGAKQCPIETPYFDGTKCIKCTQTGSYFSFDGLRCSTCSGGNVFNSNLHACVSPTTGFQTNPKTAPNLIYSGTSKNEWETRYYQAIQENPSIADCPTKTPYFDGQVCVTCPSDFPYFNLEYRMCQVCDTGSKYDSGSHECLSNEGNIVSQKPNIEKMAAGIFA